MNKKVYRRNNYVIIEDSTTNDIEFSKHAENVLIEPDPNDTDLFRFFYVFNYKEIERRLEFLSLSIGQIEDQLGVVYSLNDFITFFTENTGPKYSSGSIGAGVESVNGDTGPDVVLDAGDINMASSAQTIQNKIVTLQNQADLNTQEISDLDDDKRDKTAQKNSIEDDSGDLQLVGDEASPSNENYYGTDDAGNKGFHPIVKYSKIVVFDSTPLSNFNTNVFTDVPGMQITIDRDGDYTFYAALNCNNDQNEEVDFTIGLTPITNRTIDTPTGPVNVNAGTQFISTFQAVNDTQRKKQDQTLDATFLLDNLETGDLVDFLLNTRNDNCDLSNRRAYGYTINSNV